MAYNPTMIFIETSIFTKEIQRNISDDSYRMLQAALMLRPDAGSLSMTGEVEVYGKFVGIFLVREKEVHCESFTTGIFLTLFLCFFHTGRPNKKI